MVSVASGSTHYSVSAGDMSILGMLSDPTTDLAQVARTTTTTTTTRGQPGRNVKNRRPHVDPLMVAAASAAGPDVTRNHYMHDFFPHRQAYASCDIEDPVRPYEPSKSKMVSQQAPRHVRLAKMAKNKDEEGNAASEAGTVFDGHVPKKADTRSPSKRRSSVDPKVLRKKATSPAVSPKIVPRTASSALPDEEVVVKCQVRTRIPTPHGHVYLYLYHNSVDQKEHLAFVADSAQLSSSPGDIGTSSRPFIRSRSLDAVWTEEETELERIVRGAYVGRLGPDCQVPSKPSTSKATSISASDEPPMVRIHSECFTGETIGSQRCDCGEQLDEAFRLITSAGRGVVVYLRQEGRGIGLLEKMRAYNLQDVGHDTVTANLLLGHGADQRKYDVAGAILRDLSIDRIRLLTNNPDKIEQIEKEGVSVVERVAMVPRSWAPPVNTKSGRKAKRRPIMSGSALLELATSRPIAMDSGLSDEGSTAEDDEEASESYDEDDRGTHSSGESDEAFSRRRAGVGMIGGSTTQSPELEKYLRTKIERMGHMIDLPRHQSAKAARIGGHDSTAPQSQANTRPASPVHGGQRQHARRPSATPHPLAASVTSVLTQHDE